jgi:Proliferating cell nuclear antigen, N-terminal domain
MLELRLSQGVLLKKILEPVKDLLSNANFDCSPSKGLCFQSMDSCHVALVSLQLAPHSFERFRCDRNLTLGINLTHLSKLLKCAGNDDIITIKADDQSPDTISFMFENPSESCQLPLYTSLTLFCSVFIFCTDIKNSEILHLLNLLFTRELTSKRSTTRQMLICIILVSLYKIVKQGELVLHLNLLNSCRQFFFFCYFTFFWFRA